MSDNEITKNIENATTGETCRLCNGALSYQFTRTVLKRHSIKYYLCKQCLSLQTETPYWINEAYLSNLAALDTGAAQRNIRNFVISICVSWATKSKNIIDLGGGDGLLCRLLRDYNLNCFCIDKYAKPTYALSYDKPNFSTPDLVTGFEVIEHFQQPLIELGSIFHLEPKFILLSTGIYKHQGANWWYLTPDTGQHIFFYSKKALAWIAKHFNYEIKILGNEILFYKKGALTLPKLHLLTLQALLRQPFFSILKAIIFLIPARGHIADHENGLIQ